MIQTTTWMNSKCMTLRERSQTQKVTYYMILFTKWEKQNSAAAAAESLQSCPTLCNPIDSSPPGSSVPGVLQARTLEWVAISFSNAWKWKVKVKSLSRVWLLVTPWTAAYQAPPSMGFSRQEYWSGVPWPSPKQNSRHRQIRGCQELGVGEGAAHKGMWDNVWVWWNCSRYGDGYIIEWVCQNSYYTIKSESYCTLIIS